MSRSFWDEREISRALFDEKVADYLGENNRTIRACEDAIEFIMAGATVIQVGTASFMKPDISLDIIAGMEKWCEEKGISNIEEIRGII